MSPQVKRFVRVALYGAGAAAGLFASPLASAQAWIFDPRIAVQAIYDDNYRLSATDGAEIDVAGGGIDAELAFHREDQASRIEIAPRVKSTFFPDDSSEESTDYYLTFDGERRTQRTRSRLLGQFSDETVVSSELLAADFPGVDLGQVVGGDGGRVSVRNRRQLYAIQPTIDFEWTERRQVALEAHYTKAAYDNDLIEQVGFTDIGGSGGIVWDVSQRSTFGVRALVTKYSPDDDSEDTTSTGLVAEWRMAPSQITNFYFRLGSNRSERDGTGTQDGFSSSSFNGGVGVAWNFQVTRIVIDALRTTVPSSQGDVVDRDELRFRVLRDFSPRVSGFFAARGIRSEGLDDGASNVRERKYYTGRAGFEWRMTRQFALEGAYEYKWQEYEGDPSDATSNGVILSVVYQPRRVR